jgi:hypothetical protein
MTNVLVKALWKGFLRAIEVSITIIAIFGLGLLVYGSVMSALDNGPFWFYASIFSWIWLFCSVGYFFKLEKQYFQEKHSKQVEESYDK